MIKTPLSQEYDRTIERVQWRKLQHSTATDAITREGLMAGQHAAIEAQTVVPHREIVQFLYKAKALCQRFRNGRLYTYTPDPQNRSDIACAARSAVEALLRQSAQLSQKLDQKRRHCWNT